MPQKAVIRQDKRGLHIRYNMSIWRPQTPTRGYRDDLPYDNNRHNMVFLHPEISNAREGETKLLKGDKVKVSMIDTCPGVILIEAETHKECWFNHGSYYDGICYIPSHLVWDLELERFTNILIDVVKEKSQCP